MYRRLEWLMWALLAVAVVFALTACCTFVKEANGDNRKVCGY